MYTYIYVLAGRPPPLCQGMARVVMKGRVLPLMHNMTAADHAAEVRERQVAALRVHPRAIATSLTSGTWNIYVPQN